MSTLILFPNKKDKTPHKQGTNSIVEAFDKRFINVCSVCKIEERNETGINPWYCKEHKPKPKIDYLIPPIQHKKTNEEIILEQLEVINTKLDQLVSVEDHEMNIK